MTDTGPDVVLLGLDAACESVLAPLLEGGTVPNLAALLDEGAAAPLDSQIPPWTPSAWPSLYTGVNPGKHGVYGFLTFDGYDWRVVNHTDVRSRSLWELLSYHDRTSVVVNVPVTHPPRPIDGAVVPGYTAPEDPACHPSGTLADVRDAVGEYRVYAPEPDGRDERIAWYERLTRMRGAAFRHLCATHDPDFGFVQFQQTDTVFHELPGDDDAVERVYAAVDEEVGAVLDQFDPDLVLVVSDHGIGRYDGYECRVNDFLREGGFLDTTRDGAGIPSWSTIARSRRDGDPNGAPSLLERAFAGAARVGVTSQRLNRVLSVARLDGVAQRLVPTDLVAAAAEVPDYPDSRAYMRDRIECGVRINLAGREPDGTVPADEYDDVRDDLIRRLRALETPEGEPVFERVVPREAVYEGPYVAEAPDVVTVPAEFDHLLTTTLRGEVFGEPRESYNHKFEGIVAAAGPAVDGSSSIRDAALFDVAPTVLSALGVPRSECMDGTPLSVVSPTREQAYPSYDATAGGAHSPGEAVEDRLSDLGYIE